MKRSACLGRISTTPLIVLAAVALAVGLWAGSRWMPHSVSQSDLQAAVLYPAPAPVPPFTLQRPDGSNLTEADLQGHWSVLFFGFTHCPDICPTSLAEFKQVWAKLDAQGKGKRARLVFISVDPERDSGAPLGRYVDFFNPEFIAAAGADEQLQGLTRSLGVLYARSADGSGGYSVDHSASALIIDPQGRRAGMFRPPFKAAAIASDLLTLMGSS